MPAYNAENVIRRSINSILRQTYKNFELIIIDDGSTDKTRLVIDEYTSNDNRIKTVNKVNGGASDARNYGLDIAKGKFVTFCDADDYVLENWLEELVANSANTDVVISGFIKDNNGVITTHGFRYSGSLKEILSNYPDLTMIGALWNKLFVRNIIETNHLRFNKKLSYREDEEFVFRYFRYCKNVNISDFHTYYYFEPDWDKYSKQIASLIRFDLVCSLFESLKIMGVTGYLYESNYNDFASRCLLNCKDDPCKSIQYLKRYISISDTKLLLRLLKMGILMTKQCISNKFARSR